MTKLTEYTSPAKQEAKIEAQRSNAEVRMLQKQLLIWKEIIPQEDIAEAPSIDHMS